MSDETFPHSLEGIRDFAVKATAIGRIVAQFGLGAAYSTRVYREPGVDSIDDIDAEVGSATDVEDPLLTAHRLIKFYVISSGDSLLSCCELVGKDHPMHIGSAALARTAAEHASRAMFLGEPKIGWKARVLRAHALFISSLQEYKSTNDTAAIELIAMWERWRTRTGVGFSDVPRQPKVGNYRGLIERYFDDKLAYDELSRPTHGNATWLTMAVIQEQKGTNYAWFKTLQNFGFTMEVCIAASNRLCEIWDVDRDAVLQELAAQGTIPPVDWEEVQAMYAWVRGGVDYLSGSVVVDSTVDPQPRR